MPKVPPQQPPRLLRRLLRAKDRMDEVTGQAMAALVAKGAMPPLLPLALLLFSGLYLFVLPYVSRRKK